MVYTFFVILIVLAALLMIGIVLIQESKGGGLASNFASSNAIMGVRKTTDFIEKATWGLAIFMVVVSVVCAYVAPSATASETILENTTTTEQQTNPTNLPGFGASQTNEKAAPVTNKAEGEAQKAAPAEQKAAPAAEKPAAQ
ncbi:MAG: preprotein translocase subunit SecG [Prevotella sp.]|nr:preprotein translocase subunit SecG [Prevotella sp.]